MTTVRGRRPLRPAAAACAIVLAAASAAHAIVYRNDMTDALSAGLATQAQFSGLGKVTVGSNFGTGTLILSDWVLTAKHVVAGNATASFKGIPGTVYTDPDANSDLAFIHLYSPASGAVMSPGFTGAESGKLVWLVGVGGYGPVANSGNGRASLDYSGVAPAGTNVVREYSSPYLYFDNANTGAASSVYESSTAPGDSGGPMFQQANNVWTVVGATNGANSGGFTHTPTNPHQSFILNIIRTATGNSAFTFPTQTAPTAMAWNADPATAGVNSGGGTLTAVTLGGDTAIGNVQVGNYHASGVVNTAPAAAGRTLTLRGPGNGRVGVAVGVNSAGGQNQSGVFDTNGMVFDAYVEEMRLGHYRPASGIATTAGTPDARWITFATTAPTQTGSGGNTSGTFNQLGGTVTVERLLLGQVLNANAYSVTQTATYTLGSATTPATLVAGHISAGAMTANYNDIKATRTLNFVNGRITPAPNSNLLVNDLYNSEANATGTQTLSVVVAASGNHALTAPAGGVIGFPANAPISGSGGLTIDGAGKVSLVSSTTYTGGTRVTDGTLEIAPPARSVLLTGAGTNIEGGRVNFTYVGPFNNPVATTRSLLTASYKDNGFANTKTLRSATANAARGIAYFDNGNTVTVIATLYGDADLDGGVSINDFNALAAQFGRSLTGPAAAVDFSGLLAFAAANDDLAAFEAITDVPEPATAVGLAIVPVLLGRRRKAC